MARPSSLRWLQVFATLLGLAASFGGVQMAHAGEATPVVMGKHIIVKALLMEVDESVLQQSKIEWNDPSGSRAIQACDARCATLDSVAVAPLLLKLKKQGGRIIAEPTLMTGAGRQVTVKSGGEIFLDEKEAISPDRFQFIGTTFNATPWRLSPEQRLLTVSVEQTTMLPREDEAPRFRSRSFSAAMLLKDRQTGLLWARAPATGTEPKEPRNALVTFFEMEEAADASLVPQPTRTEPRPAPSPTDENHWQFRMSAVLLTIANADLHKVGIDWNRETKDGSRTAILEVAHVASILESLKENGGQVISRPQLTTIDGQEASVQTGHGIRARASDAGGAHIDLKNQFVVRTLVAIPTRLAANRSRLDLALENGVWMRGSSPFEEKGAAILTSGKFRCQIELEPHKAALISVPCLSEPDEQGSSPRSFVALLNIDSVNRNGDDHDGEVAELRGEIKQLREQIARLREPGANIARVVPAAPRRIAVDRALATEPVDTAADPKEKLISKIYSVADLVVPVPDVRTARGSGQAFRVLRAGELFDEKPPAPRPAAKAEFGPLVELIAKTVEPDSWKKDGRNMLMLNANLGLGITQTQAVHEQIEVLLEELRSKQDKMVQVEIEVFSVSTATADEVGLNLENEGCTLSPEEAKAARDAYREAPQTRTLAAPRITLLNKQLCEVETSISRNRNIHLMLLGALIDESEPETIRLNLAVNAKDAADAVRHGVSTKLAAGQTHVLDITDRVGSGENERGVPVLHKIPYVSRLFKNVGPDKNQRTLLFIKPTVRTASEEP